MPMHTCLQRPRRYGAGSVQTAKRTHRHLDVSETAERRATKGEQIFAYDVNQSAARLRPAPWLRVVESWERWVKDQVDK